MRETAGASGREHRVFERQEHADIAAAGVERADERDDQQRPQRAERCEPEPGERHQQRRAKQQSPHRKTAAPAAHRERRKRRAEQGRGAEDADFHLPMAQRQEIGRQQHRDETIRECAQRACGEQQADHVISHSKAPWQQRQN